MTNITVVVLGAGVAGLLAAAAVTDYADTIIVVERDNAPGRATLRRGVPQGRHLHGLLSSGALAIDTLLPGTLDDLIGRGAHRVGLAEDTLIYGLHGWMRRSPSGHFILGASRSLVQWTIHRHLRARQSVRIVQNTEVVELLGNASRVVGVRTRDLVTGDQDRITADLVIDATGRRTRMPHWLDTFGCGTVDETVVDAGLAYASRAVETSAAAQSYRCITVQPDPRQHVPARGGFWLQIENNRTMITLSGTRGAQPPLDDDGFVQFARNLRHPLLGELVADAVPLTRIGGFRDTANRRCHYHRLPRWPAGLLVIGDAVAAFNPVYGQGMSVAALSALALRQALPSGPFASRVCRNIQRDIARSADLPWVMCVAEDIRYPDAEGAAPRAGTRLVQRCGDRLRTAAATDPVAAQVFFDLLSLSAPLRRAVTVPAILATIRGTRNAPVQHSPSEATNSSGTTTSWLR
ncbi:NAD(P)/FAD-dependent oxidoreductase [Nocardia brasiliensis]